jgi:hypothetical protein
VVPVLCHVSAPAAAREQPVQAGGGPPGRQVHPLTAPGKYRYHTVQLSENGDRTVRVENTYMTVFQSIKPINTCRKVPLQVNFFRLDRAAELE